jgi:hypothetical protein
MERKELSRKIMLTAGILAVIVILCSQTFQKETRSILSKIKTERTDKSTEAEKKVVVATPADAVTSGQAVEIGDANPSLIREIIFGEEGADSRPAVSHTFIGEFFKMLFRVVISPQAP